MTAAFRVEMLKLVRSQVGIIASLALLGGTLALLGGITAALTADNPELIAKAGAAVTLDWHGLLVGSAQVTAAGGLIGFGVVLAWMFAREFTDGTITGIFGLPVSRARIASAKFIVYALWVVFISLVLGLALLVMGLMVGYGYPVLRFCKASDGRLC